MLLQKTDDPICLSRSQKLLLSSKWEGERLDLSALSKLSVPGDLLEKIKEAQATLCEATPPPNCMGTALFLAGMTEPDVYLSTKEATDAYLKKFSEVAAVNVRAGDLVAWEYLHDCGESRFAHAAILLDASLGLLLQRRLEGGYLCLDRLESATKVYDNLIFRQVFLRPSKSALEKPVDAQSRAWTFLRAPWED